MSTHMTLCLIPLSNVPLQPSQCPPSALYTSRHIMHTFDTCSTALICCGGADACPLDLVKSWPNNTLHDHGSPRQHKNTPPISCNPQQPARRMSPHSWPPQQPLLVRGVPGAPPAVLPLLLLPLTADASRLASFFPEGTSRPGFRLKKPKGLSINPVVSTGITGKSSGRTMCLQQHQRSAAAPAGGRSEK